MGSLRSRSFTRVVAMLVVMSSLASLRAFALDRAELELQVEPRSGIDAGKLRERLRVELADASRTPVRVHVSSAGARTRVELVFDDGSRDTREADLSDAAAGESERVLALAIAEQVRASPVPASSGERPFVDGGPREATPVAPPSSSSAVLLPVPSERVSSRVSEPPDDERLSYIRTGLHAALGMRVFGKSATLLVEPRVGVALRHGSGVRLDIALLYAHAESTDPLGVVVVNAFGGSLGASFDKPLGGAFSLRAGPRFDLSAAFAEGSPASGSVVGGTARAPLVVLVGETELRFAPTKQLGLSLAVDLGGGLSGLDLRADERTPSALYGVTFGVRLGLLWGELSSRSTR